MVRHFRNSSTDQLLIDLLVVGKISAELKILPEIDGLRYYKFSCGS